MTLSSLSALELSKPKPVLKFILEKSMTLREQCSDFWVLY